jgi:hypothetical protein
MTALANLAKYQGKYDQFLQIRQRYNLKWSKGDSIQHFNRFFNEELTLDVMLQRIKEMIAKTPSWVGKILQFAMLVGLRASECIESVRLLNRPDSQTSRYYNPDRQALEHFRFPEIFIRQTKKAYLSFVTPYMLDLALGIPTTAISYNNIRYACWSTGIKCDMHLTRKIFASWLRKEGIQPEIVDLLQGRVSQSILTRHYLAPSQNMKDDVLKALEKLQQQLSDWNMFLLKLVVVMISSRNIILREWTSSVGTEKAQVTAGDDNRRRAIIKIGTYIGSVNVMG